MTDTTVNTRNKLLAGVMVLLVALVLVVTHIASPDRVDNTAGPACRPVCTQYLSGICVGRWIPWRIPYPCYPY